MKTAITKKLSEVKGNRWQPWTGISGNFYRNMQSITIEVLMNAKKMAPIHPGEILKEEFLDEMNLSQYRLAKDINVPPRRINEIVHGKRAITADTALRLGRYFGMSPQFWINLQTHYDLQVQLDKLGQRLETEVKVYSNTG